MSALDADASDAVPWGSPTVQVVLASTMLAPLGVPLISPALPAIRDAFGLSDLGASLLVSGYFLTGIVLSPFIGLLADRFGRRRVLVPSLFVFSLAGASIALRPPFPVVLATRIVQGTAAAGIFITTVTLVGDAFDGVRRNAVLGVNAAVLSAGAAIYPLVGGALTLVSWNAPFVAYLVGLPVSVFALRVLEEPTSARAERGVDYLRRVGSALSAREATALYGSAFLVELLLFGAVITALPFFLAERYALSPVLIGAVVTGAEVASMVAAAANGRIARYLPDVHIVASGFGCAAVGLVGMWLAPSPLSVGVAAMAAGAGWGLVLPSVDAGVSDLVAAEYRAGALSLRNSTTFLGRTTGPVVFATAGLRTGYQVPMVAAGLIAAAGGVLLYLFGGDPSAAGEGTGRRP